MVKTVAERQREYPASHQRDGDEGRLNTWISTQAYSALEWLPERHAITKGELIELLVFTVATDVSAISKRESTEWERTSKQQMLLSNDKCIDPRRSVWLKSVSTSSCSPCSPL